MNAWQWYLFGAIILSALSWFGLLEYRVRLLTSKLNMANWTNEKTEIQTAVSNLPAQQRISELKSDIGGPSPKPAS